MDVGDKVIEFGSRKAELMVMWKTYFVAENLLYQTMLFCFLYQM